MEYTEIAQASPDIAPEGVVNFVSGRIPELKEGKPRFKRSNLPLNDRIFVSGGTYREMSV
jgi:hypothetical protein